MGHSGDRQGTWPQPCQLRSLIGCTEEGAPYCGTLCFSGQAVKQTEPQHTAPCSAQLTDQAVQEPTSPGTQQTAATTAVQTSAATYLLLLSCM